MNIIPEVCTFNGVTPVHVSGVITSIGGLCLSAGKIAAGISFTLCGVISLSTKASQDVLEKIVRPKTINDWVSIKLGSAVVAIAATIATLFIATLSSLPVGYLVALGGFGSLCAGLQAYDAYYFHANRLLLSIGGIN